MYPLWISLFVSKQPEIPHASVACLHVGARKEDEREIIR